MAYILRREILSHPRLVKNCLFGSHITLACLKTLHQAGESFDRFWPLCVFRRQNQFVGVHITLACLKTLHQAGESFDRFWPLRVFRRQNQFVGVQFFSNSIHPGKICWEGSTRGVLLSKLETALRDHQIDEAWVIFHDFKNLYGFPTESVVCKLITELCYSSDSCWLGKARDLVISILKENSNLLHPEILTKLALSFARAQMTVPASMILRVMLEREHMPPMNIFSLVVFHMVQTEIGACLASNILVQICYCFLSLSAKRNSHAKGMKPDTMFFNIILDACVRYRFALKGQQIVELMSQIGVIADAHTIAILAHIHEMNGQRDEIKKFKDHIDRVSASFVCHYQQYYDSLLNLHFMFDDIDAAAELVLDMLRPREFITSKAVGDYTKLSYFVPIGSCNLKVGSKLQIEPELLQKDSILNVEHKEDLIAFRNGKLLLNNRALAKLIIGFKNHGRIADLSNLLHSIQKDFHALEGSNLCSDVIDACIHVGWLQTAHDILDDMEAFGDHMNLTVYMVLLTAYYSRRMFKEAKALQRQMRKAGLILASSDEMIASTCLAVSRDAATSALSKSDLAEFLVLEMKEEKVISPIVYALNSSVYFFCKAKMIKDALKSYHRIQGLPVLPTSQTFAYLIFGYTSLERYRDITILWGDIKRYMKGRNLVVSRDLYELFLLNFIRGGYFERVMEVIAYMEERNMFTDKLMYKSEFLRHHKNLYTGLKASDARTEAQKLRLEYVKKFRKWVSVASI